MKFLKILLSILLTVVLLVTVLLTVMFIIYPRSETYVETQDHPYMNWMHDYINQDTLLKDVVIPGSHDSGSANLDGSMFAMARYLLACQNSSIKQQLEAGVRYFDLRTMLEDGDLYIQHADYVCQKFSTVVEEINEYIKNQKDFLILNMQHFTTDEAMTETYKYLVDNIDNFESLCITHEQRDFATLTLAKIDQLGKRLLIIWGSDIKPDSDFLFDSGKKSKTYETLYSPYIGEIHASTDEELIAQFDKYIEESKLYDGLFNLQCQRTWSKKELLMGPEQLEKRFSDKAKNYLESLTKEQLDCINIIHRDFVTSGDKILTILKLNEKKGNTVKAF